MRLYGRCLITPTTWRWLGVRDGKFDPELAERDKAACKAIHAKQVEKYGKDVVGDEPELTTFPVMLSKVAERDGEIVDFMYIEAIGEFCQGGIDAEATAALRRHAPEVIQELRNKGFRILRTAIPNIVNEEVSKPLVRAGFKEQGQYDHYLLDMR